MTGDPLEVVLRVEFEDLDADTSVMLVGLGDGPLEPDAIVDMRTIHVPRWLDLNEDEDG